MTLDKQLQVFSPDGCDDNDLFSPDFGRLRHLFPPEVNKFYTLLKNYRLHNLMNIKHFLGFLIGLETCRRRTAVYKHR